jgi:hypothetical protein
MHGWILIRQESISIFKENQISSCLITRNIFHSQF